MTNNSDITRAFENIAKRQHELRRRLEKVENSPADLRHAAIDGGTGTVLKHPETGEVIYRMGFDPATGSATARHVGGVAPPQPEPLTAEPGGELVKFQHSGLDVHENAAPANFKHAEIHVSQQPVFEPNGSTLATFMQDANGSVTHRLPAGTWYAAVLWESMSGARSAISETVAVDVAPLMDADEVEAELEIARADLAAAQAEFEAGNAARKSEIENLNDVVIPQLEQDLADARQETQQALDQLDEGMIEHADNIADAQQRLSAAEDTLAPLPGQVSAAVQNSEDAQQAAEAAEARAVEANNRAMTRLANGNFEQGLDYWVHNTAQLVSDAHSGTNAAQITGWLRPEASMPVVAGQIWELSFYHKGGMSVAVEAVSESNQRTLLDERTVTSTGWADSGVLRVTVPVDVDLLGFTLHSDGGIVDDVVLRDVTDVVRLEDAATSARQHADTAIAQAEALQLAIDGPGGLKDRLSTAETTLQDKADSSQLPVLEQRLEQAFGTGISDALTTAAADAQDKADAAQQAAETKAQQLAEAEAAAAASAAQAAAAADALAQAEAARDAAIAAAADDATDKAAAAQQAAETAAAATAQAKADAAKADAIAAAASDAQSKADAAVAAANQYADAQDVAVAAAAALDAQNKANAAQAAAEVKAQELAEAEAQAAQSAAEATAAQDALEKANAARDAAIASAATDAQEKANAAQQAAEVAAAADAKAKADAAQAAAIAAAATDAQAKADAAQAAAIAAAEADATAKANAAQQAAIQAAASDAQAKADAALDAATAALREYVTDGSNLVYNGSFEQGWAGWATTAGELVQSNDAHSGDYVVQMGAPHANQYPRHEWIATEKGRIYLAEYWAKKLPGGDDPQALRIYFQVQRRGSTILGSYASSTAEHNAVVQAADMPENEWVKVSGLIEIEYDNAQSMRIAPHVHRTGTQFHIDDVRLYDVTAARAALSEAQAASQAAQAAHAAAGDAANAASAAMTRAANAEDNAKQHADELPKVLHGTSAPAGTAPNGSIWWQHQGGGIVGQWNRVNGNWQSTPLRSEAIAGLDVGKLTAGDAEINEAVVNVFWAALAVVQRLEATEAYVGGANIKDGAITAEHITATRSIVTKILGAEWAYVAEQLVVEGNIIAGNVDAISAALKSLTVTERADLVSAYADELYANEFTARTARLARAVVAAPNFAPPPGELPDEWQLDSPWTLTTSARAADGMAFRATPTSEGRVTGPRFPVTPGETLKIEYKHGRIGSTSANGGRFLVGMLGYATETGGITSYGPYLPAQTASASWDTPREGTVQVPEGVTWAAPTLYMYAATGTPTENAHTTIYDFRVSKLVDGNLLVSNSVGAREVNAQQLFTDEATANIVWSEIVRTGLLTAEEALIGGALIKDDTINVEKMNVTSEMVGEFAKFLHLVVDQMNVNALWADTAWLNAVEAASVRLRSVINDWETVLSGQGMEVTSPEGQPTVQLGNYEETGLTLYSDGEATASMTDDGHVSGKFVSANDEFYYQGDELSDILALEHLPRGVVAYVNNDTGRGPYYKETGLMYTQFMAVPGRLYKISFATRFRTDSPLGYFKLRVSHTAGEVHGWPPVSVGNELVRRILVDGTGGFAWRDFHNEFYWTYPNPDLVWEKPTRMFMTVEPYNESDRIETSQFQFVVEDIGLIPDTHWSFHRGGSDGGSGSAPDPEPTPDPPKKTKRVKTYSMSWWRTWWANGNIPSSGVGVKEAAQGRTPYFTTAGTYRSMIGFPSMTSDLSGADIDKIEVRVRVIHSHSASGGYVRLGTHNRTSRPSSYTGYSNAESTNTHFGRGQEKWVTLPSSLYNGFKNGTYRGVTMYTSSTSSNYYVQARPDRFAIRVTYRK